MLNSIYVRPSVRKFVRYTKLGIIGAPSSSALWPTSGRIAPSLPRHFCTAPWNPLPPEELQWVLASLPFGALACTARYTRGPLHFCSL